MSETSRINEAVGFINQFCTGPTDIAVILGSGLGSFIDGLHIEAEIPYSEIPQFPISTVKGHVGKLIIAKIDDRRIIIMSGRFHYYEGYSAREVTLPIRVLKRLGVKTLFITNAAGGVNPDFKVGDLMVIKDHISFAIVNPLIGLNDDNFGPRFPDMSEPYSKQLISKAKQIADIIGIPLREGVYFGVTGPSFETRAEYKLIKLAGADAVGMSTVQEVIAASHCGISVFAVSVITNLGISEEENNITHEDVLDTANPSAPLLANLFKKMISQV